MLGYINNISQNKIKHVKKMKPTQSTPINKVDTSTGAQVNNLISNIQSMNIRN